jgi:uncharacterized membrane protein
MGHFLLVLAIFVGSHLVGAVPSVRRALIARWSETGFLVAYGTMSTALFAWLLATAMHSPTVPLWPPMRWAFAVTVAIMPVALVLLGASLLAPNPLSIALVPDTFDPARPGAVAITRHPILWGLGLWGLAHVPPNGDTVMVTLFGSLGVFAFLGMALVEGKKRAALGEERWRALAAGTSLWPFAALLSGRARWPTDRRTLVGALLGALAAGALLVGGHLLVFNRDPLALF